MIDVHIIISFVVALAYLALALVTKSRYGLTMSPDGGYYFQAGRGEPVPVPYCFRPLVPIVCGDNERLWYAVTYIHIAMTGALAYLLGIYSGLGMEQAICAAACLGMSRGFTRAQAHMPALVDAHAFAWAMLSAVLILTGHETYGAIAAIIGGFVSEKVPFFAAVFAWSLIPLFAVPGMVAFHIVRRHDTEPTGIAWLDDPYTEAVKALNEKIRGDWYAHFVAPLGIAAIGLASGSRQAYAALVLALLPIVRALDYNRLLAWGMPLLIIEAVKMTPMVFLPLLPLVHQYIVEQEPSC